MKQDLIYFGEAGLTSTSANHVADMAKHYQEPLRKKLNSITFVKESIEVIGGNSTVTQNPWSKEELQDVKSILFNISKADILCAYLREAVKAKTRLLSEVRSYSVTQWAENNGITIPDVPNKEVYMTEDDYLASLTIKEREEFLEMKQMAVVFGSYIHPEGQFAIARDEAFVKRSEPSHVDKNGRDTIITRWEIPFSDDEINSTFYDLQEIQREYQARFNGLKHKMELAIIADTSEKDKRYNALYSEWGKKMQEIQNEFYTWQKDSINRISDLKIIIPNDLKDIYDTINSLGKKGKE